MSPPRTTARDTETGSDLREKVHTSAFVLPNVEGTMSFAVGGGTLMQERDQAPENEGITAAMSEAHHNVYVVLLAPEVWEKEARFRSANPGYEGKKPCVYVGMTGLSPEERLQKHLEGKKANRFVFRYGVRLLPELYGYANPMPYEAAREMEVELAIGLKEEGYAVWQA